MNYSTANLAYMKNEGLLDHLSDDDLRRVKLFNMVLCQLNEAQSKSYHDSGGRLRRHFPVTSSVAESILHENELEKIAKLVWLEIIRIVGVENTTPYLRNGYSIERLAELLEETASM